MLNSLTRKNLSTIKSGVPSFLEVILKSWEVPLGASVVSGSLQSQLCPPTFPGFSSLETICWMCYWGTTHSSGYSPAVFTAAGSLSSAQPSGSRGISFSCTQATESCLLRNLGISYPLVPSLSDFSKMLRVFPWYNLMEGPGRFCGWPQHYPPYSHSGNLIQ